MVAVTSEVILLVLAGSLLRVLVGINKSMARGVPMDRKRAFLTLIISVIAGFIAVLLFDTSIFENRLFIIAVAFGGVDGIEIVYKFIVKKLFGMSSSISYDVGSASYPQNLTTRQRRAVNYLRKYGRMKNDDYQRINKVSHRTAVRDLDSMVVMGAISAKGTKKGRYYEMA